MTGSGFASATAMSPGDGTYGASIAQGWDIGGNANGGYLLAIVGRALVAATGRPDPITVTGHFLSPGQPGPVSVTTTVVKSGRRFGTVQALLRRPSDRSSPCSVRAVT